MRTSSQIRCDDFLRGVRGWPKTSIVRLRPASLTILPRGLSRSRRSARSLANVGLAGIDAEEIEGVGHGRVRAVRGVYLGGVSIDKRRFYGHLSRGWVQWRTSPRAKLVHR